MSIEIEIPELSVVALIGTSSSGKTSFAKKYFKPTEVLSSDYFRALISDDENNQKVTPQAFDTLYYVANKRLELGLLTVIDATNVQREARMSVLNLAKGQNCPAVAIVLDMPEQLCQKRHDNRTDRDFGYSVIKRQSSQLRQSLKHLQKEGFLYVYTLTSEEEAANVEIIRSPLHCNKKSEHGPFDIIGDIHGCYDELCELLAKLGYSVDEKGFAATPPEGRRAVFLGDLCDRGPKNIEVLRLVMNMVAAGAAYCVAGNHDMKLLRKLRGSDVSLSHGLDKTVGQLEKQSAEFVAAVKEFLDGLISHYIFDNGKLVAAHAGLKEKYHGRTGARVRDFCLYGETTGETDEYGLPVRLPWANEYRGKAAVVYGHMPTPEIEAVNNAYCIDTGCVFGGKLSAFKYPEKQIVQIEAKKEYYAPVKPFLDKPDENDMLNIEDVTGQRYLNTRLCKNIKINAENSAAALEIMSRFAVDPRWLIYLPPTMSPCETSKLPPYLEYPTEAFDYYSTRGVKKVVCEQKHMGSRAVVVLCKDKETAERRFKTDDGGFGIIYTRTGRRFFDDEQTQNAILIRLQTVLSASHFWDDFNTDWVCLDAELMPWLAKAQKLLQEQYAPAGCAGCNALNSAAEQITKAIKAQNGDTVEGAQDLSALLKKYKNRAEALELYTKAYRRYCWDITGIDDYKIAPFHILAVEDKVCFEQDHVCQMETIAKYMTKSDPIFMATNYIVVDLSDENSITAAVNWWEELTNSGGEGMVVKPYDFVAFKNGKEGEEGELLQPAVKCRGREYLRIIYGPEYMLEANLPRLKNRSLGKKRALALNEFALGAEALERFVRHEPLHRIHECVFGVLAMESEPVDPRL